MPLSDKLFGAFIFSGVIVISVRANFFWLHKRKLMANEYGKSSSNSEVECGTMLMSQENIKKIHSLVSESHDMQNDQNFCELKIVNELEEIVIICWVDESGNLHHFYPINDRSIKDGSVENCHTEFTQTGHAFLILKSNHRKMKKICEATDEDIICCYRPTAAKLQHYLYITRDVQNNRELAITLKYVPIESENVINTADKVYLPAEIHGFKIMAEPNVFEVTSNLQKILSEDLLQVQNLLPLHALQKLQHDTTLWINTEITFGPKNNPIIGNCCTFHPLGGEKWLAKMGMSVRKAGGIEVYCAEEYLRSRNFWGRGGVLVHELSHAYHNKHCPNGFDCSEIKEAYDIAMEKKLYHAVPVHGPQGDAGLAKAYACANCMEFWAELSVAYHWKEDSEYNKWFPHNRKQLQEHDAHSFNILRKYWEAMHDFDEKTSDGDLVDTTTELNEFTQIEISINNTSSMIQDLVDELVDVVSSTNSFPSPGGGDNADSDHSVKYLQRISVLNPLKSASSILMK